MKVYLVFRGCYSDRTCMAVFDNKEQAEKYSELLDKEDSSDIEEFEVNEINVDNCVYDRFYWACIYIKDFGNYKKGEINSRYFACSEVKEINPKTRCCIEKTNDMIKVYSTISEEHARKVAIEQYQIYTQQQMENGEVDMDKQNLILNTIERTIVNKNKLISEKAIREALIEELMNAIKLIKIELYERGGLL